MKKLIPLVVVAVAALTPGTALARHSHARHHHKRHHRSATRDSAASSTPTSTSSSTTSTPTDVAGSVASFDGTTLVITLSDGSSVSGTVTPDTEIACESSSSTATTRDHGDGGGDSSGDQVSGEDGSGDSSGSGTSGEDDSSGDGGQPTCSTADLTPGAVVREAKLDLSSSGAQFEEVTLVK